MAGHTPRRAGGSLAHTSILRGWMEGRARKRAPRVRRALRRGPAQGGRPRARCSPAVPPVAPALGAEPRGAEGAALARLAQRGDVQAAARHACVRRQLGGVPATGAGDRAGECGISQGFRRRRRAARRCYHWSSLCAGPWIQSLASIWNSHRSSHGKPSYSNSSCQTRRSPGASRRRAGAAPSARRARLRPPCPWRRFGARAWGVGSRPTLNRGRPSAIISRVKLSRQWRAASGFCC